MLDTKLFVARPNGHGAYEIHLPTQPDALHPRLATHVAALQQAQAEATDTNTTWHKAGRPHTGKHHQAAQDADDHLRQQLNDTVDLAAATSGTALLHAVEQYRLAAAKFERARADAIAALKACATHANLARVAVDKPASIGVDPRTRDPLYLHVVALASEVQQLRLRPIAD